MQRLYFVSGALLLLGGCVQKSEPKPSTCEAARKLHEEFEELSNCYKLGPPREMLGIWSVGFEVSKFVADGQASRSNPFLNASISVKDASACPARNRYGGATNFKVEFVGQRVLMPDLPYAAFVVAKIEKCTAV